MGYIWSVIRHAAVILFSQLPLKLLWKTECKSEQFRGFAEIFVSQTVSSSRNKENK